MVLLLNSACSTQSSAMENAHCDKSPLYIFHVSHPPLFEPNVFFVLFWFWGTVASLWSPTSLSILTSEPKHQVILHTAKSHWIFSVDFFFFSGTIPCQPKHDCARVKTTVVWNIQTSLSATNNNATFKVTQNLFLTHDGDAIECYPFAQSPTHTWLNAFLVSAMWLAVLNCFEYNLSV